MSSNPNPEREWFGEEKVSPEEKTGKVIGVFDSVASKYDIMNDFMSGGLHRVWKDRFVRDIRPKAHYKYLDVAGGTGDIAFKIRKKIGCTSDITVFDLNENMLRVGRDRAINKGWLDGFTWNTGNAESLPFPDNSFDIYTIAFGLRNVTHIDTALKEAHRVLKPGGRFFCLEFSHVEEPAFAKLYDIYSYNVIPRIGQIITKDRESYQYLVESIRKFPTQRNLKERLEAAGFATAKYTNLSGGIVAVHQALKA
ncbi:MAG: bifunctional demethylmenaquinone methyltransferase/2-methoxy-6-polyprenyl-1,4-benzoquinol methylase UbiE [Pseudomonadota bacterium]